MQDRTFLHGISHHFWCGPDTKPEEKIAYAREFEEKFWAVIKSVGIKANYETKRGLGNT